MNNTRTTFGPHINAVITMDDQFSQRPTPFTGMIGLALFSDGFFFIQRRFNKLSTQRSSTVKISA